jgi:hypothetical protein
VAIFSNRFQTRFFNYRPTSKVLDYLINGTPDPVPICGMKPHW